jgi:hypothetical protein
MLLAGHQHAANAKGQHKGAYSSCLMAKPNKFWRIIKYGI